MANPSKGASDSPRPPHKVFQDRLGLLFLTFTVQLIGRLPRGLRTLLADVLGSVAYVTLGGYRRLAAKNLELALGCRMDSRRRRRISRRIARNVVGEFFELAAWLYLSDESRRLIRFEGLEHLDAALAAGRGAIAVTAHLSNFPLISVALTLAGYRNVFMMQQIKAAATDEYFNGLERRLGVEIIDALPRHRAAMECLRSLKQKKIVIMALDLDARNEGVFVEFFGIKASTFTGPFVLARRVGSPVLPVFLVSLGGGAYLVKVHPPLPPADHGEAGAVPPLREFHRVLEAQILQHPDQCFWLNKRWRTRPPGDRLGKIYRKGY